MMNTETSNQCQTTQTDGSTCIVLLLTGARDPHKIRGCAGTSSIHNLAVIQVRHVHAERIVRFRLQTDNVPAVRRLIRVGWLDVLTSPPATVDCSILNVQPKEK